MDWVPEMSGDTPQTRMATQFEYYQAFKDGACLLRVVHDDKNAGRMTAEAAAQKYLLNAQGTFGDRWQPNAYAVLSGVATKAQYAAIWRRVLSHVGKRKYRSYVITLYYNFYVVSAMAKMGHRRAALKWIRQYWGGMVQEGATSFWEAYDPTWFKGFMYQASLQVDGVSGFFPQPGARLVERSHALAHDADTRHPTHRGRLRESRHPPGPDRPEVGQGCRAHPARLAACRDPRRQGLHHHDSSAAVDRGESLGARAGAGRAGVRERQADDP